jgi:hypothetical protein
VPTPGDEWRHHSTAPPAGRPLPLSDLDSLFDGIRSLVRLPLALALHACMILGLDIPEIGPPAGCLRLLPTTGPPTDPMDHHAHHAQAEVLLAHSSSNLQPEITCAQRQGMWEAGRWKRSVPATHPPSGAPWSPVHTQRNGRSLVQRPHHLHTYAS